MNKIQVVSKDLPDIKDLIKDYKYALLYYISETVLCCTTSLSEVNWNELTEAYFFDEKGQIHVFDDGEKKQAVVFSANDTPYVEKNYDLLKKYDPVGKYVVVREYLALDEDGQSYVAYTALVGIA